MTILKTAVQLLLALVTISLVFSGEGRGAGTPPLGVAEAGLSTTPSPAWLFNSVRGGSTSLPLSVDSLMGGRLGPTNADGNADALEAAPGPLTDRVTQRTEGVQDAARQAGDTVRYLDDHTLVPKGGGRLLISTTPFRYPDRSGRSLPIDLRLQSTGSAWEPRSAPVATVIGQRLSQGVQVDGLRVQFATAAESDPVGQPFGENSVVFSKVAPDTDAVVAATTGGAELFTIVRSADSPEHHRIEIDMPADARLVTRSDGGAQVEAGDGTPRLSISAPEAEDVKGRRVPVRMSVGADGRSLVLVVPHHGRGFAYPLLIDPVVSPWLNGSGSEGVRLSV